MAEKKFGVCGAGTMGAGIAYAAAAVGYQVVLNDISQEGVDRGMGSIDRFLATGVERGKISEEDAGALRGRITGDTGLESMAGADIVVEAVVEDLTVKQNLFGRLEEIVSQEAILATNTSSLSVTEIAGSLRQPERFIGMHFFNPAHIMKLVEIIRGYRTSSGVVERTVAITRELGKTPVIASDTPGFIVNRVARNFYGEALKIVGEGAATVEQVDRALKGIGFRMGPFELMDLIGIDINFAVTRSVHDQFFGEPRFRPHLIQKGMVDSGRIGKKAGGGFYSEDS